MSIDRLKEYLKDCGNIVFFGGAGVSTASNIPDFRSAEGLYGSSQEHYSPEVILSHDFFIANTEEFYRFYREKMIYKDALPNDAHIALAMLEKAGKLRAVITQNIDNLHQAAGSVNVLELHGSVYRNRCMKCNKFYGIDAVLKSKKIPLCSCGGIIKPEVVLYQESLDTKVLRDAIRYISEADVLIVGGTSLTVYPAAGLATYYKKNKLILINKTPTSYDSMADLVIYGNIAEIMRKAVME